MPKDTDRPLKVFLCHASGDKPQVRVLYKRLLAEGVDAWLDQEKLLPGQDWRVEIPRAVKEADVVVICLSNKSITKEGYVQKEIKFALDIAEEKPEGSIFLIPARLEDCLVPDQMSRWQWVDLFEENGFIRLLRSLKLRADKVGAVIQASSQAEDDEEIERRINQLYTEGLAAFYTEEWDRACQRFQTIISERPNHKNATEKLEQAERQRDLAKLYTQATHDTQSEKWEDAIRSLEEISRKSVDYKDASQLLRNAKKQKQLRELYAEAKTLHSAQKWQAVLKVFDQISTIDPDYPDLDGLLPSAQKEMAERRRLAELNELYGNAVHEMDSGHWYEARKLLEQVRKSQTGFLETERLLRKVENEILKLEDQRKRVAQVQVLYEQARKMARTSQWGKALAQMEEIRKLENQFVDSDGIEERSKTEMDREEQVAQKRRELAALYAEAVSLLDAKRYQEALEKWNTVQSIEPTYKDTSRVRATAKRKLDELSWPEGTERPRSIISSLKTVWITPAIVTTPNRNDRVEWLILLAVLSAALIQLLWKIVTYRWSPFESVFSGSASLFILLGLYGVVVTTVYKSIVTAWNKQSSWILIIGWALGGAAALIAGNYFDLSLPVFIIIVPLASALAMRWANASIRTITLVFIFWALAWRVGNISGAFLESAFEPAYIPGIFADSLSILLGLVFTIGAQFEGFWKIVETSLWGALGFALGNYINGLSIWNSVSLPAEFYYALWGLIGGAMLAGSSRDWRRILFSAGMCGLGLLLSGFVGNRILAAIVGETYAATYPERSFVLQQILSGTGLGLAVGLLMRRGSAIGLFVVLGIGVFILTRPLNLDVFHLQGIWAGAVRGAIIGLVIGFGYGSMSRGKLSESKVEIPSV